jgi:hypothetical protein
MYPFYQFFKTICLTLLILLATVASFGQPCTPQGDGTTYGTNNVWIAYMYQGTNFDTYKGYATEGSVASPNFDESFGGDQTNYAINGCPVYTDIFSVRYKLNKTFADGDYLFTVGADDGYRLSLDGGLTWVINNWGDHGYTTSTYSGHLNGPVDMVLEFYENQGGNRVSFDVVALCVGDGNPAVSGTANHWIGYLYQGTNFDSYKGYIPEGNGSNLDFNESFGTPNGNFSTSNCFVTTENFSARFRTTVTFVAGTYQFTVGGDDGYRLSVDGGNTWIIDRWFGQSYNATSVTVAVSGTRNLVLEYFEQGGSNQLTFTYTQLSILPVTIMDWSAKTINNNDVQLNWKVADAVNFDHFTVQKSNDAQNFRDIQRISGKSGGQTQSYTYTDLNVSGSKVYYRLAIVDKDASVRYSTIATVSLQQANQVKVYPTIVENKQVYIESGKKLNRVQIELVDMSGRILQTEQRTLSAGRQTLSLDAFRAGSATGSYIVRITGEDGILARQPVIIR